MGNYQCVKCGIPRDSPYISKDYQRKHCRIHHPSSKNNLICRDCNGCVENNHGGCYHRFRFVLCGFTC